MRCVRFGLLALTLLLTSLGSAAWAQTVTPMASQLQPCRAGGGFNNTCGGLCAVGFQCMFDASTTNGGCLCIADASTCEGTDGNCQGSCSRSPKEIGGRCTNRAGVCRCE